MISTDFLKLSDHPILKTIQESVSNNVTKTLNALTVKDNVLFIWDFQNYCVLSFNLKAFGNEKYKKQVVCQKLLPLWTKIFPPDRLVVNDSVTYLVSSGPSCVLVFELPTRCPPFGAFDHNKELVYCKIHSIEERLFMFNDDLEPLQVKFHPGSAEDNHLVILTSDNQLRIFQINEEVVSIGVYSLGHSPMGKTPSNTITFTGTLYEIAIDFDFGQPEIGTDRDDFESSNIFSEAKTDGSKLHLTNNGIKIVPLSSTLKPVEKRRRPNIEWPIYILCGDFIMFYLNVSLYEKSKSILRGPIPLKPSKLFPCSKQASSILCLNTTPQIICLANNKGEISHGMILPKSSSEISEILDNSFTKNEQSEKEIDFFEVVEIELGRATTLSAEEESYTYPLFLYCDDSSRNRYFAVHSTGVHMITLNCFKELQQISIDDSISNDLFNVPSSCEHLICTKMGMLKHFNPVVGFSLYYNQSSLITLLADGNLISLPIRTSFTPAPIEPLDKSMSILSPKKKHAEVSLEEYVENLLKKANLNPVMKLSKKENYSIEDSYQMILSSSTALREKINAQRQVKAQIERSWKSMDIMKNYQMDTIKSLVQEKQNLQEKAENLAEKYEDIKDKQDKVLKRCAKLMASVSMKKEVLSDAERNYLEKLKTIRQNLDRCDSAIEKLLVKKNYQENQMRNWKAQMDKKKNAVSERHCETIKENLVNTSEIGRAHV